MHMDSLDEDEWTGEFAKCDEVVCPPLEHVDNGKLMIEGFKFQQSVYYECDNGYLISGSYSRTCLDNGAWSGSDPKCLPVICNDSKIILM